MNVRRAHGTSVLCADITLACTPCPNCTVVQASPNVNNIASIKMQEAVGGNCAGEKVHEFPEHMRDYTQDVRAYIYHVRREDWEKRDER